MSGRHFTHIVKLRVTVAEPLGGGKEDSSRVRMTLVALKKVTAVQRSRSPSDDRSNRVHAIAP